MNTAVDIDVVELTKNFTVVIKLKRYTEWRVRWWLAKLLLFLAARVANCNIEVVDESK
jgi:hypothetical protein